MKVFGYTVEKIKLVKEVIIIANENGTFHSLYLNGNGWGFQEAIDVLKLLDARTNGLINHCPHFKASDIFHIVRIFSVNNMRLNYNKDEI